MDRDKILSLYEWALGVCFRHPSRGEVPTAHVKTIRPPAGGLQEVRACRECVVTMESQREQTAARDGESYKPGNLADSVDCE